MLIIVESPAKAKTISRFVGKDYDVKASVGHVRGISSQKKTKDGRVLEISGIDIDDNFNPIFEVDEKKKDVVKELKKLSKKSGAEQILFATDEDREGEAISWHLAELLKIDPKKIKRLVFHEITKPAIEKALKNLRPLNLDLVEAQKTRQILDKLVGFKLSPVLWKVMKNNHLSAGRVQSPALRLIYEREMEIRNFISKEYYEVWANFKSQKTNPNLILLQDKSDIKKNFNDNKDKDGYLKLSHLEGKKLPPVAESITAADLEKILPSPEFTVGQIKEIEEKQYPKPPFTTSTLQQAASSRLGFTPRQTMSLAQKLYEGVKVNGQQVGLITYMRTDSTTLSNEALADIRKYIATNFSEDLPQKAIFYKSKSRNAQEAHEAIRPTFVNYSPQSIKGQIDDNQWKLYNLIWSRCVSCQMNPLVRKRFSMVLSNNRQDQFTGSFAVVKKLGFQKVWNGLGKKDLVSPYFDYTKESLLLNEGQILNLEHLNLIQFFTSPPSRFSPASLVKKLEELGIGRPSTYASIISTLVDRQYAEINKNIISATTLGEMVCQLLIDKFEKVTISELTAEMELNLDKVADGELDSKKVLSDFWYNFKKQVDDTSEDLGELGKYRVRESNVLDPETGEPMVVKMGRFGEYYQNINNPEKMYPIDFKEKEERLKQVKAKLAEEGQEIIKCPNCEGEMELKSGRFGEYFQCKNDKKHMFPTNFKEYFSALKEAQVKFSEQITSQKCINCQKDLIVRVSKPTLNPYIACPDYKVGNKHTVKAVTYGPCPKCQKEERTGQLLKRKYKGKDIYSCNLAKKECGFVTEEFSKI